MATGEIRDAMSNVKALKVAHTAAVTAGDVIVNNGQVLVALHTKAINTDNIYAYQGRVEMPKEANLAINPGDVVYWVAANGNVNKTAAGNTKAGVCVEAAAQADTTVLIELRPNV